MRSAASGAKMMSLMICTVCLHSHNIQLRLLAGCVVSQREPKHHVTAWRVPWSFYCISKRKGRAVEHVFNSVRRAPTRTQHEAINEHMGNNCVPNRCSFYLQAAKPQWSKNNQDQLSSINNNFDVRKRNSVERNSMASVPLFQPLFHFSKLHFLFEEQTLGA